ncbi:MAG TPA: hypothetical protein PLD47_16590 [Aggregatilineales bacterium]|nr:hypothetical protein [Anaerolineales bacterium]HRE49344.1 hypothetical protein [Aggregatilineales bacterium]
MDHNKRIPLLAGILALALVATLALSGMGSRYAAQGDIATSTQPPTPEGNGGTATWTIGEPSFESNYPRGFTISLNAESSAGRITGATVFWQHSPKLRNRVPGKVAADGKSVIAVADRVQVPQWVAVTYWWVLTDEKGNSYQTERRDTLYEDNTRVWNHLESEDLVIYWQQGVPDKVGELAVKAMDKARPIYRQRWAKPLGYRPHAIIYADYATWEEWNRGVGTSVGGVVTAGQTSDSWGGTAQVWLPSYYDAETLADDIIVHEVAHLYQYANGGTGQDFWFFEGNATYFELLSGASKLERVRDLARSGELPSLQAGGPSARGRFALDAYNIGYAFWLWVEETYGVDAHKLIWKLIDEGRGWKNALETVTQLNFIDMETAFRAWAGATNAVAPTPIPSPTMFFFPSPTYEPTSTPKP